MDLDEHEVAEKDLDAEVLVEKTSDELRATVQVFPPSGNGRPVNEDVIRSALLAKGVVFGLDESAIHRIVAEQLHYQSVTVASGKPAVDGEDAKLVYHYTKDKKVGLQEDSRGKVDFRELNRIVNVTKEELVLEKVPAVEGEPGVTVCDKKIAQRRGKDIRLRIGKNIRSDPDGLKFYAEKDGQVVFRNYMLAIEDVFSVQDVDSSVGNIRFKGSVQVTGGVADNYEIQATESVHIGGTVGAATIVSGGNVVVAGGLVGSNITAHGAVQCKFAEEATINAKGDVLVEEYTKNCQIRSFESVVVRSSQQDHGSVIGGYTSARKKVEANNIGSEAEITTEVRVGVDPEAVDKLHEIRRDLGGAVERFEGAVKNLLLIQRLKESGRPLDEKKIEMLKKIFQASRMIRDQMADCIPELISRSQSTIIDEKGKVNVINRIHANVTTHINHMSMTNRTVKSNCSLVLLDGDVTIINLRKD